MRVRQLYAYPVLPTQYIVELENGSFKMFSVCGGFRKITEKDLRPVFYKPQKEHTRFIGEYLYTLYGLEKIEN